MSPPPNRPLLTQVLQILVPIARRRFPLSASDEDAVERYLADQLTTYHWQLEEDARNAGAGPE